MTSITKDRAMARSTLIRTTSLAVLMMALQALAAGPIVAGDQATGARSGSEVVGSDATATFLPLGLGKSVVVDLPARHQGRARRRSQDRQCGVRSARRAYLIGAAVGQTNIFFFDADGRQIAGFDIAVTRDLNGVRGAIQQTLPGSDVRVAGDRRRHPAHRALSPTPAEAQHGLRHRLARWSTTTTKVVNNIIVHGRDQVMLKVTVAEVRRDVIKQLGINSQRQPRLRSRGAQLRTRRTRSLRSASRAEQHRVHPAPSKRITATLQAMERAGVLRTLAEPTLTAISGESATFLAGGEFPIPIGSIVQHHDGPAGLPADARTSRSSASPSASRRSCCRKAASASR